MLLTKPLCLACAANRGDECTAYVYVISAYVSAHTYPHTYACAASRGAEYTQSLVSYVSAHTYPHTYACAASRGAEYTQSLCLRWRNVAATLYTYQRIRIRIRMHAQPADFRWRNVAATLYQTQITTSPFLRTLRPIPYPTLHATPAHLLSTNSAPNTQHTVEHQ
jgi:hypothetical protein